MAGIYISLISKELKVLHRFFPPNLFFFFLIRFRYRSEIISASLVLSRTLTQAAGASRLPSIVLGLEKWQPGESTWLGDVARGRGRAAWLLRPLVFSPGRIEAVTLLPHRCYTWKRVFKNSLALHRHPVIGGWGHGSSHGVWKPRPFTSGLPRR